MWWQTGVIDFPTNLFIYPPQVFLNVGCGDSYLMWHSIRHITKNNVTWYYVMDTNNARYDCTVTIYCAGNWK